MKASVNEYCEAFCRCTDHHKIWERDFKTMTHESTDSYFIVLNLDKHTHMQGLKTGIDTTLKQGRLKLASYALYTIHLAYFAGTSIQHFVQHIICAMSHVPWWCFGHFIKLCNSISFHPMVLDSSMQIFIRTKIFFIFRSLTFDGSINSKFLKIECKRHPS